MSRRSVLTAPNFLVESRGFFKIRARLIPRSPDGLAAVCLGLELFLSSIANGQTTWTAQSSGVDGFLAGVAEGNGLLIAVGFENEFPSSGVVASSPDGITWTPESVGTIAALRDVTYAQGLFVAVGDAGSILTSPDGQTWDPRSSGVGVTPSGIAYGDGVYTAVGLVGTLVNHPMESAGPRGRPAQAAHCTVSPMVTDAL